MSNNGVKYILDVRALFEYCGVSANARVAVEHSVMSEQTHVYNCCLSSFKLAYPDEVKQLVSLFSCRKRQQEPHRQAAAVAIDANRATFGVSSPYDKASDWNTLGIAIFEGYTIVTSEFNVQKFCQKTQAVPVISFDNYLSLI